MPTVGVIVNPVAGKDIRRLVTAASHTSDSAKIGIVRRVAAAAVEEGATRVVLSADAHNLSARAIEGLSLPAGTTVEVLDEPVSGSRADTVAIARRMWKEQVDVLVVLGGDGTCRDVAIGWPDARLIAVSTGTNNVFPRSIDATSAGCAAGLIASGRVDGSTMTNRSKRVSLHVETESGDVQDDLALVDAALIETTFVGSRAVLDPRGVSCVVAAFATPASTGLSAIAGRVHPVDRFEPAGVAVLLAPGGRKARVPLSPGTFTTVEIAEVRPLALGETIELVGPGVLAVDGERDRRLGSGTRVTAAVDLAGPLLVDVDLVLRAAAALHLFEEPHHAPLSGHLSGHLSEEDASHGD